MTILDFILFMNKFICLIVVITGYIPFFFNIYKYVLCIICNTEYKWIIELHFPLI